MSIITIIVLKTYTVAQQVQQRIRVYSLGYLFDVETYGYIVQNESLLNFNHVWSSLFFFKRI
jgi:hypothetical protein